MTGQFCHVSPRQFVIYFLASWSAFFGTFTRICHPTVHLHVRRENLAVASSAATYFATCLLVHGFPMKLFYFNLIYFPGLSSLDPYMYPTTSLSSSFPRRYSKSNLQNSTRSSNRKEREKKEKERFFVHLLRQKQVL